jgi:hypothetical protein
VAAAVAVTVATATVGVAVDAEVTHSKVPILLKGFATLTPVAKWKPCPTSFSVQC